MSAVGFLAGLMFSMHLPMLSSNSLSFPISSWLNRSVRRLKGMRLRANEGRVHVLHNSYSNGRVKGGGSSSFV